MTETVKVGQMYDITHGRTVCIDTLNYSVGSLIPKSDYYETEERKQNSKYSLSLIPYALQTKGMVYFDDHILFSDFKKEVGKDTVKYSYKRKDLFEETEDDFEIIVKGDTFSVFGREHFSSSVTRSIIASLIGQEALGMEPNTMTPGYYCDKLYFAYLKDASIEETTDNIPHILPDGTEEVKEKPKKTPSKKKTEKGIFERVKDGEFFIPYEWPEAVQKYIVPLSFLDDFVPFKEFYSILNKISVRMNRVAKRIEEGKEGYEAMMNDVLNIALSGPPGTGKTYLCHAISAATHVPLYAITVGPHTCEEVTEGSTKVVGSELTFVEAELGKWAKYGGIALIDEMVAANTDAMFSALAELLEFPYHIYENGFKEIIRHPLAACFMAYNNHIQGGKTITEPLINRFNQSYELEPQEKSHFIDLLMNYNPDNEYPVDRKKACEWVYDCYQKVVTELTESRASDIASCLSLRTCYAVLDNIAEGEAPRESLRCFWVPVRHYSEKFAKNLKNICDSVPDLK